MDQGVFRGLAFANFRSAHEADAVVAALNGFVFHIPLVVSLFNNFNRLTTLDSFTDMMSAVESFESNTKRSFKLARKNESNARRLYDG